MFRNLAETTKHTNCVCDHTITNDTVNLPKLSQTFISNQKYRYDQDQLIHLVFKMIVISRLVQPVLCETGIYFAEKIEAI